MEDKKQDRFPEMAFPGMEKVLDVLPHPGKMFLEFFKIYNRFSLHPVEIREYGTTQVVLHAFKGDSRIFSAYAHEEDAMFRLDKEDRGFFVQDGQSGLEWEEMKKKRRTFIFNKVRAHLAECRFYLQISGGDIEYLSDPEKFVSYFWAPSLFQNVKAYEQSYIDVIMVGVQSSGPVQDRYKIKGLEFRNTRRVRWGSLIPHKTIHRKVIEVVVLWQENWRNIKHLLDRGVEVDLEKNWQKCQKHIRTELAELMEFERILKKMTAVPETDLKPANTADEI